MPPKKSTKTKTVSTTKPKTKGKGKGKVVSKVTKITGQGKGKGKTMGSTMGAGKGKYGVMGLMRTSTCQAKINELTDKLQKYEQAMFTKTGIPVPIRKNVPNAMNQNKTNKNIQKVEMNAQLDKLFNKPRVTDWLTPGPTLKKTSLPKKNPQTKKSLDDFEQQNLFGQTIFDLDKSYIEKEIRNAFPNPLVNDEKLVEKIQDSITNRNSFIVSDKLKNNLRWVEAIFIVSPDKIATEMRKSIFIDSIVGYPTNYSLFINVVCSENYINDTLYDLLIPYETQTYKYKLQMVTLYLHNDESNRIIVHFQFKIPKKQDIFHIIMNAVPSNPKMSITLLRYTPQKFPHIIN